MGFVCIPSGASGSTDQPRYESGVQHLSRVCLDSDSVFGDSDDLQIPKITGDPTAGYTLAFTCAV